MLTMDIATRFWRRVTAGASSGCWEWSGPLIDGYGHFRYDGKLWKTHRFAWLHARGPIPAGLYVLHECDNRKCVRPEHLYIGTAKNNARDREVRKRGNHPQGEKHGCAKLDAEMVRDIRLRAAQGETRRQLAAEYGVTMTMIGLIILRKNWAHI